ncbi:MAG: hypothetical protein ACRBCL_00270 [Maritimibacter sp.]
MELHARAEKLAKLMEERLDVLGSGLDVKLSRVGKRLPKSYHQDVECILLAVHMDENPKLAPQIDWQDLDLRFARVERYLRSVSPWTRRQTLVLKWLAVNALNILLIIALFIFVLISRGLV